MHINYLIKFYNDHMGAKRTERYAKELEAVENLGLRKIYGKHFRSVFVLYIL